jgi:hypothetical protein
MSQRDKNLMILDQHYAADAADIHVSAFATGHSLD